MWKQKNQGFHWENSAFLGRNFSLACAMTNPYSQKYGFFNADGMSLRLRTLDKGMSAQKWLVRQFIGVGLITVQREVLV